MNGQRIRSSRREEAHFILNNAPAGKLNQSLVTSAATAFCRALRVAPLALLLLATVSARAQNYAIDWFTIDGGGGKSTGGVFSVSGTIGQPDAGKMSGGNFSVDGGFWGIVAAVQTPGAPLLTITRTTTNTMAISWFSPATGFTLQQNTNSVSSLNWSNVVTVPTDDGTTKTVVVNPPTGNRFYRLFKP